MKEATTQLTHCSPKCTHFWIWTNGPCCSVQPGERIPIPEECFLGENKHFPEFCGLEEVKKEIG